MGSAVVAITEDMTIPAMMRAACVEYADRDALVDAVTRVKFAELGEMASLAAKAMIGIGVERGDRVAIWAPNVGEWVVIVLGALAAGATIVPINTRYKGHEAADIIDRSGARVLFTMTEFLDTDYVAMLRDAAGGRGAEHPVADLPGLKDIVVIEGHAPAGTMSLGELLQLSLSVTDAEQAEREAAITPDAISDIMFTSGTTGRSKGVMTTHAQTLRTFDTWSRTFGIEPGDRYLIVNPFFHTFGYKAGIVACVMRGATIIPHAVFEADSVLQMIGRERVTVLPGPPALFQSIMMHPDVGGHDISTLRLAITGAASIPVRLIERMRSDLGFDQVLTAYGLTESTGVVTMCRHGDSAETIALTSGRAIDGVEVRTVDEDGQPTAPGVAGEIVLRGYNVMEGYLDDPEATAATIRDGWLHTGDIGVLDADGNLDITDRLKDMFIVGGFNAYPAEIENDLLAHADIAQVAVIGVPDERLGEVGFAVVVPTPGTAPDADELRTWAKGRLANFKVPRSFEIVDALPMNASGKVLKNELRARFGEVTA